MGKNNQTIYNYRVNYWKDTDLRELDCFKMFVRRKGLTEELHISNSKLLTMIRNVEILHIWDRFITIERITPNNTKVEKRPESKTSEKNKFKVSIIHKLQSPQWSDNVNKGKTGDIIHFRGVSKQEDQFGPHLLMVSTENVKYRFSQKRITSAICNYLDYNSNELSRHRYYKDEINNTCHVNINYLPFIKFTLGEELSFKGKPYFDIDCKFLYNDSYLSIDEIIT